MITELKLIDSIVSQIGDEKFDCVMGCGRGSLVPMAYIAHKLGIESVHHLSHSRGSKSAGMRRNEAKFLIVDDISDTGDTFKNLLDRMGPLHKTAALYQRYSTKHKCDFVGEHINHDEWLEFSWENKDA